VRRHPRPDHVAGDRGLLRQPDHGGGRDAHLAQEPARRAATGRGGPRRGLGQAGADPRRLGRRGGSPGRAAWPGRAEVG